MIAKSVPIAILALCLLAACSTTRVTYDEVQAARLIDYGVSSNIALRLCPVVVTYGFLSSSKYEIDSRPLEIAEKFAVEGNNSSIATLSFDLAAFKVF